jgi:hypothetical protein
LLRERYGGRAGIVRDIESELLGLERHPMPQLADSAQIARQQFRWIERITVEGAAIGRAEELRTALEAFKRHPGIVDPMSRRDWGECVTLAEAERRGPGVLVVANDDAARGLAGKLRIPTTSAVGVLRAMVRDAVLTRRTAFARYQEMVAVTDAGDPITGPSDF